MPEITGSAVLTGGSGTIGTVCGDVAAALPAAFAAVTTTRIVLPTSAVTATYVAPVAPAMSAQALPEASQRRHW